jgi:hypothetical protein
MEDEKLTLEEARAAGFRPPQVYSVPRRFGVGTIMGVATAYALLLWGMQQLDWPPSAIIINGVFLTLVGVMQVVWTKSPRWASMLVGGVCFLGVFLFPQIGFDFDPCTVVGLFVAGLAYGYLGGALVAGVFLVMDMATRWVTPRSDASTR